MQITHDDLVQLVRASTEQVFTTMLGLEFHPADAYLEQVGGLANNGVVSFIGLAGSWVGTGSISCSPALACTLAGALMMSEYTSIDEEVLDAVAEVTNMIMGNVKTALEDKLGPMGLSIPTVVYGRNFSSRTVGKQEWSVVPFNVGEENLEVQVCLAPSREAVHQRLSLIGSGTMVTG